MDASVHEERRQLNLFLTVLLGVVAVGLWLAGQSWGVVAGVASSAVLVGVAHVARRWLKMSLHVAFATFSVAFLWPRSGAMLVLLTLAAAIAWSRLVLSRHTRLEVAVGGAVGLAVGALSGRPVADVQTKKRRRTRRSAST